MLIETLQLLSYGPFADTGEIRFAEGMNLIVGQNNSGKSSILKSLRNEAINWPHRNLSTYRDIDLIPSAQRLRVRTTGAELRDTFISGGGELHFRIPYRLSDLDPAAITAEFFSPERAYVFDFQRQDTNFASRGALSHGGFESELARWSLHLRAARPTFSVASMSENGNDTALMLMQRLWNENIFRFDAERMSIGKCVQQDAPQLTSNASNLPAVLQRMQGRQPTLFAKLEARVREIVPSVYGIRASPVGNEVEIIVWPTSHMDRPEHGFALNESGTGVAQVLAILAAVMTRERSVIVIDEINSFLHPAAVKALLRILASEFQSHQYILSTHSAEVISSSNPATLTVVKRDGFDSSCRAVSSDDVNELRDLSDLLGISIGDVFAADRVLWVEGRTEELCFPFLMNHWSLDIPRGLIISPVVATGDFSGRKDVERVLSIYNRLSRVTLPLVRSVTFSFDSEDLSEKDREDSIRRAKGRVMFLPRRHLECFLIHPGAIAAFINKRDEEQVLGSEAVELEILNRGGEAKYGARAAWEAQDNEAWLREVDAANLIADVVKSLTDARVTFKKTNDTLELLETVADLNPEALDELKEYLGELLALVATDE